MIWKKRKSATPSAAEKEERPQSPEAEVQAQHRAQCTALCCASRGDSVCVKILLGTSGEAARLREMGLCEGARVEVLRHGNPIVVRVADSRLGLAHALAERVLVVPAVVPVVPVESDAEPSAALV